VDGFEDARVFDADGREIVYVKKATVVDLIGCHAPVSQPVPLLVE
jgi:hypothetical protein